MSTRSMIGMEMPDKTIKAIYCHFDGYLHGVGKVLNDHYTDPDKVEKLIELGDLSVLGTWYDEGLSKMSWTRYDMDDVARKKYDALAEDMTITYRSRGEDDVDAKTYKDLHDYQKAIQDTDCDYAYVFMTDYTGVYRWHYIPVPYFKPVDDALEDE